METQANKMQFLVSSSPHVRSKATTARIMLDVVIALLPALIASVVIFGIRALFVTITAVVFAVLAEFVTEKILKRPVTVSDFSAVVTGILLAFNLPASMPLWMVAIAAIFSIVIVKQLFGGIGSNFMNPALAGRAFLLASWPKQMAYTTAPFESAKAFTVDAVAVATPLSGGRVPELWDLFIGARPGMLGEVSAICLLIGAIYLLIRGVIHLRIPAGMIISFAVFMAIFGQITGEISFGDIPAQILSGGMILGACFMATDYATNPMTVKGQMIFAIGCGLITAMIRSFGGYPEGVSYAILLMNIATPLIDKLTMNKPFGGEAK